MIVQCENCSTKFNLPDERIPKGGAKVKCSKCGHIFKVTPPPPPEPEDLLLDEDLELDEGAGAEPEPPEEDDEDLFGDDFDRELEAASRSEEDEEEEEDDFSDFPDDEEQEEEADEEYDEEEYDEEYDEEDEDEDADLDSLGLDDRPARSGGSRKTLVVLLVLIIVLGGLGAAGWYFKGTLLGLVGMGPEPNATQQSQPAPQSEGEVSPPVSPGELVKNIGLKNVRQYYLDNEKAGQLFVVEGKAVNNFDTPKEMITVQADLYDGKGAVLVSKTVKCGNTLSMYQLQVETPQAIEEALAADVGVLANNTYLKTGMDTPFMVVFFNPPAEVREFQVKVTSAQDAKE